MQHLEEGMIHAWLDGELPPGEREAVEAHVASCDECKAAVAEARGFIAGSSRILMALDAVPGGVLPASSATPGARAPRRFTISRAWMAAAAVLVLSTATVIAVRPRRDAAAQRVAEASRKEQPTMMAPNVGPRAVDSVVTGATAAPPLAPLAQKAASLAPPPRLAGALAEAREKAEDKSSAEAAPMRKDVASPASVAKSPSRSENMRVAQAAPAAPAAGAAADLPAPAPAEARRSRAADANVIERDTTSKSYALRPPTAQPDSSSTRKPIVLQQLVITGEGTTSSGEKLGATFASAETPRLVSRRSEADGTDSVVTTVYTVSGTPVTLIDRSSARDETKRDAHPGFSDQVAAKSRASAPLDSLTWTDSTGRTRTLRGALSLAELERVKAALFGATP